MLGFERSVFQFVEGWIGTSPFLDVLVVFFAEFFPYIIVLGALVFIYKSSKDKRTRIYQTLFIFLTVLLSRGFFGGVPKYLVTKARPFNFFDFVPAFTETGNAFPSGHAAVLFAIAIALYYFSPRWGKWFLLAALVNGIARVLGGVHWTMDIVGGIVVALLAFFIVRAVLPPPKEEKETAEEKIF